MMLGGHAAEEMVFGEMSTGASDDISKVTKTARAMVTRFGMSERLGPRTFGRQAGAGLPGPRDLASSATTRRRSRRKSTKRYAASSTTPTTLARTIIRENRAKLDHLARTLLEIETLEGDQLLALMAAPTDGSEPPNAPEPVTPPAAPQPPSSDASDRREDDRPSPTRRPGLAWGSSGSSQT